MPTSYMFKALRRLCWSKAYKNRSNVGLIEGYINNRPTNRPTQATGQVGYVRIDWESIRHKKNARRVIYKGLQRGMGVFGKDGEN